MADDRDIYLNTEDLTEKLRLIRNHLIIRLPNSLRDTMHTFGPVVWVPRYEYDTNVCLRN